MYVTATTIVKGKRSMNLRGNKEEEDMGDVGRGKGREEMILHYHVKILQLGRCTLILSAHGR